MTVVNVVQPTYFAILSPDTLGTAYADVCATNHLPPITEGYGIMMGVRADMTRITLVAVDPSLVAELADMPGNGRDGLAVPDGGFPVVHDGWLDLPDSAIIGRAGKLVIIGPVSHALGPTYPVHPLAYLDNGLDVGDGRLGYARGDELDVWRRELRADGWVVDDRAAGETVDDQSRPPAEAEAFDLAGAERVARIGPPVGTPPRAVHEIAYIINGVVARHGLTHSDLEQCRAELTAAGWTIDDQSGTPAAAAPTEAELEADRLALAAIAVGGVHAYGDPFDAFPFEGMAPAWSDQLKAVLDAGHAHITGRRTAEGWPLIITAAGRAQRANFGLTPLEALALTQIAGGIIYAPGELFPSAEGDDPGEVAERAAYERLIEAGLAYVHGPRHDPEGWPVAPARRGAR